MNDHATAIIAAIRAQPWAILPEYLDAIEALAVRALASDVLARVAADGHRESIEGSREAVAATGKRLEGAWYSTVRDGVAVVPVLGAIFPRANIVNSSAGGSSLDGVMRDFRVAQNSADVERIVMLFDSPGGVVSGLSEAADAIAGSTKPVTAFVTGMAASAAYWLASQASEIVIERAASVGSIGVIATVSKQEAVGADGRRSYEIVSSGAPMKRPDPSTDEGRAALQSQIDALEKVFIADVARGRKVSSAVVRSEFGRGGMVSGEAAIAAGMADRIGTLEGVLSTGARRTGQKNNGSRRALAVAEIETRRRAAEGA